MNNPESLSKLGTSPGRNELAQQFRAYASRIAPFRNEAALKWSRRVEADIQDGLLETGDLEVARWLRRLRGSPRYESYVLDFLLHVKALHPRLLEEDSYRRLLIKDRLDSAQLTCLSSSDRALVHEYLTAFLARGNSELSIGRYVSSLNWLETVMKSAGVRHLADVRREHIGELLNLWKSKGLDSRYWAGLLGNLKTLFAWLNEEKGVGIQPVSRKHFPRNRQRVPRPLRRDEVILLTRTLDQSFSSEMVRALFYLILATGLRISEAIALRLSDVDRDAKRIFILHGKGGTSGWLPIAGFALQKLDDWLAINPVPDGCQHVFHHKGFQISVGHVQQLRKDAIATSGITFGWHQLRTTFATRLAEANVGPFEIQRLLRHQYLDTIMTYIKCGDSSVRQAYISFVDKLLSSEVGKGPTHLGTAIALFRRKRDGQAGA